LSCAEKAEPIEMPFGFWAWMGPWNHVLDGVQISHAKGQFYGERACPDMPDNTLT